MRRRIPLQVARGFGMGAADVVPGVSGGTVALVLGIYGRLVAAIHTGVSVVGPMVRLDLNGAWRRLRDVDWAFLLPLVAGIGLAVLTLSHLIERLLEEQPVVMAALFFGLVAGAVAVTWRLLAVRDASRLAVMATSAVVTFLVLGWRAGPSDDPALWAVLAAGAVAVCAMILPGISGSFLLLMLGMYEAVLAAVNQRDLGMLAVFVVGCVLGLAAFSSVLQWLLTRYEQTMTAALIGLMIGSLRVLWPWPDGTEGTTLALPQGAWLGPVGVAVGAFLLVVVVARLAPPDGDDQASGPEGRSVPAGADH